jgi:two-component system, NarL family, response regulator YdfI
VTRVLIAAASAIARAGLESLVATAQDRITVVGSASDVASLAQSIEELQPDVVVLDSETEETASRLLNLGREMPLPAIVVLAAQMDSAWIAGALRSGVRAVLPREASADGIIAAIEAVAAGFTVLPSDLDLLQPETPTLPAHDPHLSTTDPLTPREIEVLGMIAEGLGNKAIALRLDISEHTVKFHVASILSKLGVSSRTEAVTVGIRQGLIML